MPESKPSSSPAPSAASRLTPRTARLALVLLAVATLVLVWIGIGMTEPVRRAGPSDLDTYEQVVTALKAGQGYYPALHAALLAGDYGSLSPLNWRMPLFLTMLSWFPSLASAQVFLALVTIIGWMMAVAAAYRRGGLAPAVAAGVAMGLNLVAIVAPRSALSFEMFTGTLILISFSAYLLQWRWVGLAAAVLALFTRELAAVYVLVCVLLALRDRRWGELGAWAAALAAFAVFYAWHAAQAMAQVGPLDHPAAVGWLQFGGLDFVLRTAAFNGVLLVLPYWVAAPVLVLGLTGLAGLPRAGLSVVLYLLVFLVFGRAENAYWGALYAPLVAFGLVWALPMLLTLLMRARQQ